MSKNHGFSTKSQNPSTQTKFANTKDVYALAILFPPITKTTILD
jgi:hypothetical protein